MTACKIAARTKDNNTNLMSNIISRSGCCHSWIPLTSFHHFLLVFRNFLKKIITCSTLLPVVLNKTLFLCIHSSSSTTSQLYSIMQSHTTNEPPPPNKFKTHSFTCTIHTPLLFNTLNTMNHFLSTYPITPPKPTLTSTILSYAPSDPSRPDSSFNPSILNPVLSVGEGTTPTSDHNHHATKYIVKP